MMIVAIYSSKTDQLYQGDEVVIVCTSIHTCQVAMLERYMGLAGIDSTGDLFLFSAITRTKEGEKLRPSRQLGYSTLHELFKKNLVKLEYQAEQYGLHSLRAGGAIAAANTGVPDWLFKHHGR